MRGAVYQLRALKNRQGHQQAGHRPCVVVQASIFDQLSTWLVAPTSASTHPSRFRPLIEFGDGPTYVMVEQTRAVDPQASLIKQIGFVTDMAEIDAALRLLLGL